MFFKKSRNIVFAIDDQKHTEKAFDEYIKNYHKTDDKITLLNVFSPPHSTMERFLTHLNVTETELEEEFLKSYNQTKKLLESFLKKCQENNLNCQAEIIPMKDGRISKSISSFSNKKADLLVLGCNKHSMFHQLILGCRMLNTVKNSLVPVLVIPTKPDEENIKEKKTKI